MLDFVTETDAERLLINRKAAVVLGIAAVMSLGAIVLVNVDLNWNAMSTTAREAVSYACAASALGVLTLFLAMELYLLKCDTPPVRNKGLWGIVMLIGLPYATVPFYMFIYLPALKKRLNDSQPTSIS